MVKRKNNSFFSFAISLPVLFVTFSLLALNGFAQDSFRANSALLENDAASVEENVETVAPITNQIDMAETVPAKTDTIGMGPVEADTIRTDPLRMNLIEMNPFIYNPLNTFQSEEENVVSVSEDRGVKDKGVEGKDSENVSRTTSAGKDDSAEIVSPWENQLLGQRPEKPNILPVEGKRPSQLPSPWKTFVSLVIVLALIVGVTYFFKRFYLNSNRSSMPAGVEILARSNMNPKQSLCLVQLGNRLVLLGQSPNHISSLQTIDDPDEMAQILGQLEQKKTLSITNTFGKLFHREKDLYEKEENPVMSLDIEDNQDQNPPTLQWYQAKGELSSLLDKVKGLSKIRFRS